MPTGDELCQGIVTDTNSPAILGEILARFPLCCVIRTSPLPDDRQEIKRAIQKNCDQGYDLTILIGGCGGGFDFDLSLAPDRTRQAMLELFPEAFKREIFGTNGHLLSTIVLHVEPNSRTVINIPGPHVEALAVTRDLLNNQQLLQQRHGPELMEIFVATMLKCYQSHAFIPGPSNEPTETA